MKASRVEIRKLCKISFEPSGRRNEKIVIFLSPAPSRKDSAPRRELENQYQDGALDG